MNPFDPADPVMRQLADTLLLVWIRGTEAHTEELVRRFDRAPKPMYYQPAFLRQMWDDYRAAHGVTEDSCDPDHFVRWTYAKALAHRQPRYAAMANWGVTVEAEEVADVRNPADFDRLITRAIDRSAPP